ncbi:single-stranded DNA-binding protein [Psychrobacter faecalis]|uniref:single-stranded DNA-binding protein n=1 Tax=Psychrobacter faecalis TaxID=180588 RepID=UPI003FD512E6
MRGVNKVILIGSLGADVNVKKFDNSSMIANISVATSEQWTDKQSGEKREATVWHRVTFNGRLAEIAEQYLRKGSKLYVEGRLSTRKYQQNGVDKYVAEIKGFSMQMLDSAGGNGNQGGGSKPAQSSQPAPTGYSTPKPSEQGKRLNAAGDELDEFGNIKEEIPF